MNTSWKFVALIPLLLSGFDGFTDAGPAVLHLAITNGRTVQYVGEPFDIRFTITNIGTNNYSIPQYSCHTAHEATYSGTTPDGKHHEHIGMGLLGGPHCFCSTITNTVLRPGSKVTLESTTTNANSTLTWAPMTAGEYVISGHYCLSFADQLFVTSESISIEVKIKDE